MNRSADTVAALQERLAPSTPSPMGFGDILRVPKMRFRLDRTYDELEGKKLLVTNPDIAPDLVVLQAQQIVQFQLDQRGVVLKSESTIAFGCSAEPPTPEGRRMIFDKPFLILMRKKGREVPYFILWVDNAELCGG